jgi:hypothetical protein
MSDQLRLTDAQRATAAELPWYRAWLLATGREPWQVDPAPPEPERETGGYTGYRCRRQEHSWCRGRWGGKSCACPCHQEA